MSILELIKTRRSIRAFTDEPVPDEVLRQLVEAACWAPTASNMQSWQFVAVRDRDNMRKLKRFSPGLFVLPSALIVICVDKDRASAKGGGMARDLLSLCEVSMAAQNIMLTAHSFGLGTCVIRSFDQEAFRVLLELPPNIVPELLVTVGYPKVVPRAPERRPLGEVLHFENWGR